MLRPRDEINERLRWIVAGGNHPSFRALDNTSVLMDKPQKAGSKPAVYAIAEGVI